MRERLLKFASHMGWRLTADTEVLNMYLERMQEVEDRVGVLLCPCTFVPVEAEPNLSYIACPCTSALLEVPARNRCLCGLFVA